ncbi:MAG: lysophospholipase [Nanoarchaeota archaeon]|nr:lysophospholipase [Nanoarchaeota archaeon]
MKFVETVTKDGLILQGLLCEPKKKSKKAILQIHGMSGNFFENDMIKPMLYDYPKNGITFLTVEQRGSELIRWFETKSGKIKLIGSANEKFEDSYYDIDAWVKFLKKQGYTQIYISAHSLGPTKVVYYMNKTKEKIKGLIFISPSDMYGLVLNKKIYPKYQKSLKEAKKLIGQKKPNQMLSEKLWDFYMLSAKTFLSLFDNKNTSVFNYFKPELGFNGLNKIEVPVLAFFGTKDDGVVTDPYEASDLLKKNLVKCPKYTGIVYKGAKHGFEGFENKIVKRVLNFVK